MLWLLILEVKGDTAKFVRQNEKVGFVVGQSVLGCCAYSFLGGMFVGGISNDGKIGFCTGLATPLACMLSSTAYAMNVGVRPYGALASFTGGVDGVLWGYLTVSALQTNGVKLSATATAGIPLGLSLLLNSGWLAYSQNFRASEGSYLTKTLLAFQSPYYYFQLKRVIWGDYVRSDTSGNLIFDDLKKDMTVMPAVSVAGGVGGFLLTQRWEGYTAGDAMFLSANIFKGSLVLSNLVQTAYLQTFWSESKWSSPMERGKYYTILLTGYYPGSPTMNRLGGIAQVAGGLAGAGISYALIKRHHVSLLGGLLYSMAPSFAYWATWAPMVLVADKDPRIYGSFMPLVRVALDVGTSYLIYRLFVR